MQARQPSPLGVGSGTVPPQMHPQDQDQGQGQGQDHDQDPAMRGTHSVHRSVLGSGITSNAVQEAQMQVRLKAETISNDRKKRRVEHPVDKGGVGEKLTSAEDEKLTPEERKRKRYERRLALNGESAAVSRVRRREYAKVLEDQLVSAEKERVRLATELSDRQLQNINLREHLQKIEGSVDNNTTNNI